MVGRVLVTGGASGIGAVTCRVLAAAGWDPIPADLEATGGAVALDVIDEAAWDRVLDGAGVLAGLVNCAGIRTRSDIVDTPTPEVPAVRETSRTEGENRRHTHTVGTPIGIPVGSGDDDECSGLSLTGLIYRIGTI